MIKLQELENHMQDIVKFHNSINTGTFPGSSIEPIAGLKKYLRDVLSQLEAQRDLLVPKEEPAKQVEAELVSESV